MHTSEDDLSGNDTEEFVIIRQYSIPSETSKQSPFFKYNLNFIFLVL